MMTATLNMLFVTLAGLTIGWILALRALADMSVWGPILAAGFLCLVIWGLIRASEI